MYIPSIRRDILEVIVGKMLKLDVSGFTPTNSSWMDVISLWGGGNISYAVCGCVSGQRVPVRHRGGRGECRAGPAGARPD